MRTAARAKSWGSASSESPSTASPLAEILRDQPADSAFRRSHPAPGATAPLFGAPADEFAGRHTSLLDLWGRPAVEWRERLLEVAAPESQLELLENLLAARLPEVCGVHPAVARALALP